MTKIEQAVKDACDKVYSGKYCQWLIDFVQDEVEELLNQEEYPTRDQPGALAYQLDIVIEITNPARKDDLTLMHELHDALEAWSNDIEQNNFALGLPRET